MTAYNIASASNMVFDEVFDESMPQNSAMDTTASASRLVSDVIADCHAVPVGVPVSPCASEDTYASSAESVYIANSVTGKYSDIEERYLVDSRVLGTGHHGSVRECVDRATGQRYAVKSIRKKSGSVKKGGLAREISLLREMKHDTVVELVDVFEDPEYVHIVTNLCTGGELFDKILEKSSSRDAGTPCFDEDEAARILRQVLEAVSYMHKNGVVHRDIKPENILLLTKEEGSPIKIIDFGLARKYHGDFEPPMRTILGTPYYIAPEVLMQNYTESCDLWSVGVIAYILMCGYPPFNGSNNDEIHRSVLNGRYRFHPADWKDVSPEAKDFIRRLLRVDPSRRMTIEEALNHPWMAKHAATPSALVGEKSTADEVVVKGLRLPRKGSILSGRVGRRKARKSMFGI